MWKEGKKMDLKTIIDQSDQIVFFGGAGVSTQSGIPDFRSEGGIYSALKEFGLPPEEIISHTFFMQHPDQFYQFYKEKMVYPDAQPNAAHIGLAKLEQMGKLKAIVTQNIDNLHQLAGSKNVIQLHGSVCRNYCIKCGKFYPLEKILKAPGIPYCDECGSIIKPDVVLYEESLDEQVMNRAVDAISNADVLIVGGTSLQVYPAAGFLRFYQNHKLVLINKSSTPFDRQADLLIHEPIGQVFESLGL